MQVQNKLGQVLRIADANVFLSASMEELIDVSHETFWKILNWSRAMRDMIVLCLIPFMIIKHTNNQIHKSTNKLNYIVRHNIFI